MGKKVSSPRKGDNQIPLRLVVLLAVAVGCGLVIGTLTAMTTGDLAGGALAGVASAAASFVWMWENVA